MVTITTRIRMREHNRIGAVASVLKIVRGAMAILGALLACAFLLSLVSLHSEAASLRHEGTGADPRIQSVTATANLPISDTHPGDGLTKTIYFNDSGAPGVLTLTFEISGTPALTLTARAAFGAPTRAYASPTTPWSPVVTYSVETGGGDYPGVAYTAASTHGVQTTIVITYELDNTLPTVTVNAPSVWQGLSPIPIAWQAWDTQSGVALTHLYYRRVPTDTTWQDSILEQAGHSGTFYFTPSGYLTYTFAAQAADNVDNRSTLPTTGLFVVVKPARAYLPLVVRNYPPTWQQANGARGVNVYDVAVCPSRPEWQYAGTAEGVFRSTDGGASWQHWALDRVASPVVVNPSNCAEAFAATWGNGVYRITGQSQAVPINQGLGDLYLYGLTTTDDGQVLYAGSSTRGVYKTSTSNVNWVTANTGILDLRIRSVYVVDNVLYAGGRQCTYYHSINGGGSWHSETILGGGQSGECMDAQVWSVTELDGVHYVGLGLDKGLYRQLGDGAWVRVTDVPTVTIHMLGLRSHTSHLYVATYGYGIYVCELDGRCRPLPNGGLTESRMRGLAVANMPDESPRLVAGSDNGIWWVPLVP